ncbi:MAG TPA: hypothetical protein ENN58_02265, partial [bacterium]|nr:hypothetical protein [bacterium]
MVVKQGVILASGLGSRLNREGKNEPKPLMPIGGLPLIERVINLMKKSGIEKIVLVLGYRSDQIENFIKTKNLSGILTVNNPEYNKKNGISLLKAKEALDPDEPFLLSMADHIFSNDFFTEFIKRSGDVFDDSEAVLSIDRDIEGVFDLDDATKVFTENNAIIKIGKDLKAYNAIDTGLFLCKPTIFDELENIYEKNGDVSISEGMKAVGDKGKFLSVDMTGFLWQDVDTPAMKYEAEQRLIDNSISSNDEKNFFSNAIIDKISKELLLAAFKRENFEWATVTPLYLIVAILSASFSIKLGIIWPSLITFLSAVLVHNVFKMRDFVKYKQKSDESNLFAFPFNASIAMIPVIYDTHPVAATVVSIAIFVVVLAPLGGYLNIISSQAPALPRYLFKTYLSPSFSFFAFFIL